jgi:hypothetical protein
MEALKLQRNINYGSILPIIVFISGLLIIYFFSSQLFAEGMITMLFSSIFYIIMIVIRSTDVNPPTQFNLILENISNFMTFAISSIMFGVMFYAPNVDILFILLIYFFAIANILSVARNWEYDIREALGMPVAFNGIFFPLFYYMYRFYFNDLGDSIFLLYYIITGILTISSFKFLWFDEKYIKDKTKYDNYYSKVQNEDKIISQRIKDRENKQFNNINDKTTENVSKEKIIKNEILEDSIIDKFKKSINNIIHKKDNFNTLTDISSGNGSGISDSLTVDGMPNKKELEETLPHTAPKNNIKKKERGFTKLVRTIFFKFGKSDENWNTIKGMPDKKELEETLSKTNNQTENNKAKKEIIKNISNTTNKPKRKEKLLTKIIKFFKGKKEIPTQNENWNTIKGMPDEKELEETLSKTNNIIDNNKQEIKTQTKPKNDEFDLVGGDNTIKQIKPENTSKTISEKEVIEVFTKVQDAKPQENEYDEEYDFDQEIDFEDTPKKRTPEIENINTEQDNEDFDLEEFENDYQEKK